MAKYIAILTNLTCNGDGEPPGVVKYDAKIQKTIEYTWQPKIKKYSGIIKDTPIKEYPDLKSALKSAYRRLSPWQAIGNVGDVEIYAISNGRKSYVGKVRFDHSLIFSPYTGEPCRFGIMWIPKGTKIGEYVYYLTSTGNIETKRDTIYKYRNVKFPKIYKKDVKDITYRNKLVWGKDWW